METKEKILSTALHLFSSKGYTASSVRDIGKMVGIKDSSLYFHFKNKREILEELLSRFIQISEQLMNQMSQEMRNQDTPFEISEDDFLQITQKYALDYLGNEFIHQFICIMMREQNQDETIRELYQEWCFERPIQYQTQIFQMLQTIGFIKSGNAKRQAQMYYAVIWYAYQSIYLTDASENRKAHFWNALEPQITYFLQGERKEHE